jgi:hypothetical protein
MFFDPGDESYTLLITVPIHFMNFFFFSHKKLSGFVSQHKPQPPSGTTTLVPVSRVCLSHKVDTGLSNPTPASTRCATTVTRPVLENGDVAIRVLRFVRHLWDSHRWEGHRIGVRLRRNCAAIMGASYVEKSGVGRSRKCIMRPKHKKFYHKLLVAYCFAFWSGVDLISYLASDVCKNHLIMVYPFPSNFTCHCISSFYRSILIPLC